MNPTHSPPGHRAPATAAAQGLPWLARLAEDEDIIEAFEALAADARPEVRFLAAQEAWRFSETAPEVFWRIVGTRAVSERSPAVQDAICRTVGYVFLSDVDRGAETLSTLTKTRVGASTKVGRTKDSHLYCALSDPS